MIHNISHRKKKKRLLHIVLLFVLLPVAGKPGVGQEAADREHAHQPALILISLDGFRWDYLEKTPTPNLHRLIRGGVMAQSLTPSFPTFTFPNHYTIVTGLYPEHHGIVDNNMFDPALRAAFKVGQASSATDGRWWSGGEPIWVTAKKQGLVTATLFWPGSEAEIEGERPNYWKLYDGKLPNRERIAQILAWLDLPPGQRPSFITLYLSDANDAGHRYGPDSGEVKAAIKKLDGEIGLLLEELERRGMLGDTDLVVTSDHGMTPVSPEKIIYLEDFIDISAADIYTTSADPVLSLWPHAGMKTKIYEALKRANPRLKIYLKEETPERFHYRNNRRIGPVVCVCDEGWRVAAKRGRGSTGVETQKGTHGYDPRLRSMQGVFIASGPGLKKGFVVSSLQNTEIYNLMAALLGLKPAPNDGHAEAIRSMLNTFTAR